MSHDTAISCIFLFLLIIIQEPLTWVRGSDVVVVDPPRKGLDPSLLEALQNISSIKHKAESPYHRFDLNHFSRSYYT